MGYRYLGNKSWLASEIVAVADQLLRKGARVADPMCGTGSVAEAFARSGYRVIASDELTFPVHHARVRLMAQAPPDFDKLSGDYSDVLDHLNDLPGEKGFFFREYSSEGSPRNGCSPRAYFTGENAARIDAVRRQVREWCQAERLTDLERSVLLHDLIMAANDVANIAGTYGYYRSTWNPRSLHRLELRPSEFPETAGQHKVVQGRIEDLAEWLDADLCYLDPPYTKRQYAGNYHILETMAVGDEPEPVGEGGLRDWYDQYSDFCSKRSVHEAFREVLKRLDTPHVLISYSEDGLVPPREAAELFSEFGKVTTYEFETKRFRSNGGSCSPVVEQLYHLEMAS